MDTNTIATAFVLLGEALAVENAATRAARAAAGQTRAEDLAARWTQEQLTGAINTAAELERLAATLNLLNERECNGHQTPDGRWDEAAAKRDEAKRERLKAKVADLLKPYSVTPRFGGDPRGAALKLATPGTAKYNTMGGREEGWAV